MKACLARRFVIASCVSCVSYLFNLGPVVAWRVCKLSGGNRVNQFRVTQFIQKEREPTKLRVVCSGASIRLLGGATSEGGLSRVRGAWARVSEDRGPFYS